MAERRIVVLNPGHFHAALLLGEAYPAVARRITVLAPLGPDALDHLTRVARFNARAERPTAWEADLHAGDDYLGRLTDHAGAIAIIAGRNRDKITLIEAALAAGLHLLVDKPWILRAQDLPRVEAVLDGATQKGLVAQDVMTGRHDVTAVLLRALHADRDVFGEQLPGSVDEPGVAMTTVHHLLKQVAGVTNPRPDWYFDVDQQGNALADIGTHLVDMTHRTLFPDQALDADADIRVLAARRWATPVTRAQFHQVTGAARWPDGVRAGELLDYACNGAATYAVRGVHVRLSGEWQWEAPAGGGDASLAVFRGSRARLELRQGPVQNFVRELHVVPQADIDAALERRIVTLRTRHPGIGLARAEDGWRVTIPAALRTGHDAHFVALMRSFLATVDNPASLPPWERPNLLAKYAVTTQAVALAAR
jgi:predicted dehydrogenase